MKKKAYYFVQSEVFKKMQYGDNASTSKLFLHADIVVSGHQVIKHPTRTIPFEASQAEIDAMKNFFTGITLVADAL